MKALFFLASVVLLTGLLFCGQSYAQSRGKVTNKNDPEYISLGIYYFDAWSAQSGNDWAGSGKTDPWYYWGAIDMRTRFSDREPWLGWYDQAEPGIVEQQVAWMIDYGIDFIVFEFFYNSKNDDDKDKKICPTTGLSKYLESPRRNEIEFAIFWGDEPSLFPEDKTAWDRIVNYWLDNFLLEPEYKRIDGKPVIFIWKDLPEKAREIGFDSWTAMFDSAKELARGRGLDDLYFVVCIHRDTMNYDYEVAKATGFDALTAYNWPLNPDYQAIMDFYKGPQGWQFMLNMPRVANGQMPFFLPLLSGFDNRPWGGSAASFSTPDQFEEHLIDGRNRILANPAQTMRTAIICAWNEHGEGSVVEPTKKYGFEYLNRIRKVFRLMKNKVKAFDDVKYYPNPIQPSKGLNYTKMNFLNMPAGTRIKIYTLLGQVVRDLEADANGTAVWDGKNNAGAKAASGVYIVYMEDGNRNKKRIKVAVER